MPEGSGSVAVQTRINSRVLEVIGSCFRTDEDFWNLCGEGVLRAGSSSGHSRVAGLYWLWDKHLSAGPTPEK